MALSDEFRINELKKGGSSAIKSKDDRGVHTYYSYVETDGESAGNIELPKYNNIELKKAVDLIVDELIPQSSEDALLTVKKKVYDDLLAQLLAERARVVELNEEIGRLNVDISELQSLIDLLRSEVDIAKLSEAALQTEFLSLNEKYTTLIEDFQSALTKGILESIERASLYAQVVGLQTQVQSLSEQLFGKTAKIQQGAKAALSFTVRVIGNSNLPGSDIIVRDKRDKSELPAMIKGSTIEIYNFTKKDIEVAWRIPNDGVISGFFSAVLRTGERNDILNSIKPSKITVRAGATIFIPVLDPTNFTFIDAKKINDLIFGTDREFTTSIIFEAKPLQGQIIRSDDSVTLSYTIQKQVGARYTGE
jgi:hypothetical protein